MQNTVLKTVKLLGTCFLQNGKICNFPATYLLLPMTPHLSSTKNTYDILKNGTNDSTLVLVPHGSPDAACHT